MGSAGAAITTIAPTLLNNFSIGDPINGWKM
jgi:NNP family nitrate/nitrite transporter-like MFS transporter